MSMPDGNSAALSQYMASQDKGREPTSADEEAAIQNIMDDYLLIGLCYPKSGRGAIDAGCVLRDEMDEDDLDSALSALVYGAGDFLQRQQDYCEAYFRDVFPRWIRAKRPDLIELRVEEMLEEEFDDREGEE